MSLKDRLSAIIRDTAYYKHISLTDLARMLISEKLFGKLDAKNKRDANRISRQFRKSAATLSADSFIKALYVLHKIEDVAGVYLDIRKTPESDTELAVTCVQVKGVTRMSVDS